jgi:TRAP-type mannitol/chloroaromatic compound transport system permease small subunit
MTIGVFLLLLQCISNLIKDFAIWRGKPIKPASYVPDAAPQEGQIV